MNNEYKNTIKPVFWWWISQKQLKMNNENTTFSLNQTEPYLAFFLLLFLPCCLCFELLVFQLLHIFFSVSFFLHLICMWIIFLTSSSSFSYSHGSTAIVATVSVWNVYFVWNDSSVQVNIWDVTKHWDRKFQLFRPERNKIQNFYTHRNSRTNYKNPNSRAKKILDEML